MRPLTGAARRDVLRFAGAAVGAFLLLNIAGQALRGPFDTIGDWVSWPSAPGLRRALALLLGAALLANAFLRSRPAWLRGASVLLFGGAACAASIASSQRPTSGQRRWCASEPVARPMWPPRIDRARWGARGAAASIARALGGGVM